MKGQDFGIPEGTLFTESHEYIIMNEDRGRVGISHFAGEQLGDVVYVELPLPGDTFEQGDSFGTIESVKAASDLYLPVSGEITSVNTQLQEEPEMVNDNCYADGWIVEVSVDKMDELEGLMTAEAYLAFLEETANV